MPYNKNMTTQQTPQSIQALQTALADKRDARAQLLWTARFLIESNATTPEEALGIVAAYEQFVTAIVDYLSADEVLDTAMDARKAHLRLV
jgi:hypothetical protein